MKATHAHHQRDFVWPFLLLTHLNTFFTKVIVRKIGDTQRQYVILTYVNKVKLFQTSLKTRLWVGLGNYAK